jgi:hypothetical protein
MPSIRPPMYANLNPMTAVLESLSDLSVLNTPKELNISGGDPAFGEIAAATDIRIGLEYVPTYGEEFVLAVGIKYTGDSGAFQFYGDEFTSSFATPISLSNSSFFFWPVPPTSYSESYDLIIRALAANDGVEKTGTLTIYDRFTFDGGATGTRVLGTISLSKTYNAP